MPIPILFSALILIGCTREPTTEKARDMFQRPSSEEQGKIPDKFQPIDHQIDKAEDSEQGQ